MLKRFPPDLPDWVTNRLVAHRHGPHVLYLLALFFELVRFHLDSASVRTRVRLTYLAKMFSFTTATAIFISMTAIRSSMAELSTAIALLGVAAVCAAFAAALATAPRGTLTCHLISHVVCTSSGDVQFCRECCTLHCAIDTSTSHVHLCHNMDTLTRQHRSPLAQFEQHLNPQSLADTDPRLQTRPREGATLASDLGFTFGRNTSHGPTMHLKVGPLDVTKTTNCTENQQPRRNNVLTEALERTQRLFQLDPLSNCQRCFFEQAHGLAPLSSMEQRLLPYIQTDARVALQEA